jgi:hypothetical protein
MLSVLILSLVIMLVPSSGYSRAGFTIFPDEETETVNETFLGPRRDDEKCYTHVLI